MFVLPLSTDGTGPGGNVRSSLRLYYESPVPPGWLVVGQPERGNRTHRAADVSVAARWRRPERE
jgi:hypothetical protein